MLTAANLSKAFVPGGSASEVRAVRNVSLTLEAGQIMALVGESGSGKSTLLHILAGLTDADAGEVRLNGQRVPGPADVLVPGHPQIRLVPQEYQLMPNVSVRENIAFALRYYDKAYRDERVDELLRLCRLTDVQHRLPRRVSGGEKQRTAIARALADTADESGTVLLLDEPFSHLDLPNRTIIRELLTDLVRHNNVACLLVTHDATDALSITDTLGILRRGKLIESGPPQTVYRRPKTAYAATMTGVTTILKAKHLPALGLTDPRSITQPRTLVCLRPEHIHLADTGIPGTVRAVYFRGSFSEIEIDVTRYVRVRLLTTRHDLRAGQAVAIQVAADDVWWLAG